MHDPYLNSSKLHTPRLSNIPQNERSVLLKNEYIKGRKRLINSSRFKETEPNAKYDPGWHLGPQRKRFFTEVVEKYE